MNEAQDQQPVLFVVNGKSGNNTQNWDELIHDFFKDKPVQVEVLILDESCSTGIVQSTIEEKKPGKVFAVGGDGTVKLVAECLLNKHIPLGIIPAGSANGMAKELGIPTDINKAMELALKGDTRSIHLIKVNNQYCIHLADIGFNAFVVKKFETSVGRGMWGYIKASWKVLWEHAKMEVDIKADGKTVRRTAAMVVMANATKYGSGALINPDGDLGDDLFEVIIVKKISLSEIYKMMFSHMAYDPSKTEVYQTSSLAIRSKARAHFQVDGEYLGKTKQITATILPRALDIIVP
ncbi:MAG: YegS/Rv2252/BmrU family lipid kinase [Ferruginibacter sp.]|nr:YegS/Rv2252/BmrU family lipid kinase [Ferruginibacter sp.]